MTTRNDALDEIEGGSVLLRFREGRKEQSNKCLHLLIIERILELFVFVAQEEKQSQRSEAILDDLVLGVSH